MSRQVLTEKRVDQLKRDGKRRIVSDGGCRGLYIDIRPGGKTYIYRYTDATGQQKSRAIGTSDHISLLQAREIVRQNAASQKATSTDETHVVQTSVVRKFPTKNAATPISASPIYRDFVRETYLPFAQKTKRAAYWEEIILRCHLFPIFGDTPIAEISKSQMSRLVNEKLEAGYAKGSINRMIAVLKTSLTKAVDWEIEGVEKNPAAGFRTLRDPPKMDRYLSTQESERLIDAVLKSHSPMMKYLIPFLLLTGARKREALDARWEHVDFTRCVLTVPLSKSGKPRHIPMSEAVMKVLHSARVAVERELGPDCPWIFPNIETGKPYVSTFHSWNRVRVAAGLKDVRMHDLRHSFASALVNRGATLYDVKEILGHANFSTTQRYAHLTQERLMEAVSRASTHYESMAAMNDAVPVK